jgi:hypothetical protein
MTAKGSSAFRRWVGRYLPAESVALLAALAGGAVAWRLTANWEAAALASNWAETAAFYLVIVTREFLSIVSTQGRLVALPVVLRNLMVEFGPAEALDSLVTRPVFMDVAMRVTGEFAIGVVIGKLVSDDTFYVPTIVSYEFRRRYLEAPQQLNRAAHVTPGEG